VTLFYKVHHKFLGDGSFRESNTNAINATLAKFATQLSSETVMIVSEQDYFEFKANNIELNFVNKRGLRNPPPGWLPGEIGVWISNIQALKEFLDESTLDSDTCLLLESDVWLNLEGDALKECIETWERATPRDWDFINLYVAENWRYLFDSLVHEFSDGLICKNYAEVHIPAILWSRQGALKMLRMANNQIHSPIDRQLFEDHSFQGYALKPEFHSNVSLWTSEALNNSTIANSPYRILLQDKMLSSDS
jgi:GR25 family glycosyltransferase involved in LPS biosynthesis